MIMIEATDVSKTFTTPGGKVTALENVSLSVPDGSFAAIIGKSGSGKSTLLSLLGALDNPTSGSIAVGGKDVTKLSASALTKYRRQLIGFVFQSFQLIPNLTALQNVMLPMEFAGVPGKQRRERAAGLLEEVGLPAEKQSRLPSRLSGGEQQRVAIARALANRPSVILADEPTGNLDSATGRVVVDLLHTLAKTEKVTIVAVTHDLGLAKEADMTFHLADGKLTRRQAREIGKSVAE
jgi:putative ABC transport system ATP-binding protein